MSSWKSFWRFGRKVLDYAVAVKSSGMITPDMWRNSATGAFGETAVAKGGSFSKENAPLGLVQPAAKTEWPNYVLYGAIGLIALTAITGGLRFGGRRR